MPAPSRNFAFLHKHDAVLSGLGALAEQYFHDDPNGTIVKCRQLCEQIAQRAAARQGLYTTDREEQIDLVNRLRDARVIDEELARLFHTVRKHGNAAVHALEDGQALLALQLSHKIALWYHRAFFNPSFKAGPFIPPRPPKDPSSELQEELARMREELDAFRAQASDLQSRLDVTERARMTAEQRAEQEQQDRMVAEQLALEAEERARGAASEDIAFRDELLKETERELAAARAQLTQLQARAETTSTAERERQLQQALSASERLELSESETRHLIDQQLRDAGWEADTLKLRYPSGARPVKNQNRAIAEWPTASGPADYALFRGLEVVGVVEAKRSARDVSAALEQAKRYSRGFHFVDDAEPPGGKTAPLGTAKGGGWGQYKVPFLFATNGRKFLQQIRTKSGIWHWDARRGANRATALEGWYTPDDLKGRLKQDIDAANAKLAAEPTDYLNLRAYQLDAIQKVEAVIADGATTALVAMATGTGKTRTALGLVYRLLKTQRFRRILFLVDRSSLGEQTGDAFRTARLEGQQTFAEIFDMKELEDKLPEADTKLHIATVQGMVKRILYPTDPSEVPSVGAYDCIVIDECHRGYGLDREMSDGELRFRDLRDYISKYRRVLDHFDAVKIGLTATPAVHTTEIFGPPTARYTYREAVIDSYLVDHEPPYNLTTELAKHGIRWEKGEQAQLFDPATRSIDLIDLEDEVNVEIDAFNRTVITENFNRVVCTFLAEHLDPTDDAKTLIFCATDSHADMVVDLLKEAFAKRYGEIEDDAVVKITGSADKPLQLIRRFKNERNPNVAVTVDLLTTGIDVPRISNLVFLRRVRSRILYEQMLGRATRLCPDIGKEVFRIFDAVALYDALEPYTEMKPVVQSPVHSFEHLAREVAELPNDEDRQTALDQLIAKLQRKKQSLRGKALEQFERATQTTPEAIARELKTLSPAKAAEWVKRQALLLRLLDQTTNEQKPLLVSDHLDAVHSLSRGYGQAQRPADYLDGFAQFVREQMNQLPALKVVTQRPRELTRAHLREILLALDAAGYTETNLQTAWREKTNADIAASIVGFIRQAALGDPLLPYEERVDRALKKILSRQAWKPPQRQWLERIAAQIKRERVVRRDDMNREPFATAGGFDRANRVFDGTLEEIISELHAGIWEQNEAS